MRHEYYEVIAADLFEVKPVDIFKDSRKAIYRVPRQFCMKYRIESMKLTQTESGKRYGLDHATAINAQKRINNYVKTKDAYGKLYNLFLKNCEERKRELLGRGEFLKKVQSMGWIDYVKTVEQPLKELIEMVFKNDNEDNIREQLDICEEKINDLKYLYKIENEP